MKAIDLKTDQEYKLPNQRKFRRIKRILEITLKYIGPAELVGKLIIVDVCCRQSIIDKNTIVVIKNPTSIFTNGATH
jgi:hypothetical protein